MTTCTPVHLLDLRAASVFKLWCHVFKARQPASLLSLVRSALCLMLAGM